MREGSGEFRVGWEGRVTRMREQLDPRTRTIPLEVAVDTPCEKALPGKRPPLIPGDVLPSQIARRSAEISDRHPPLGTVQRQCVPRGKGQSTSAAQGGGRLRPAQLPVSESGFGSRGKRSLPPTQRLPSTGCWENRWSMNR